MKILLVEDHDALRHNIEAVLKSEGYTVVPCADGIDAEFQIMNNSSDLILLDRMLPGQDGLTITRKARAQGITTPILLLTALDSLGDKVSGLDAGADDYIVKPFAKEILLARVERHLERYQQRQHKKSMELSDYAKQIKSQLTPTEWKIAIAIAEGMENKEIAESMHYSYGYVKNLVARIFSKLEIEKRRELKKLMVKE